MSNASRKLLEKFKNSKDLKDVKDIKKQITQIEKFQGELGKLKTLIPIISALTTPGLRKRHILRINAALPNVGGEHGVLNMPWKSVFD